ncbi:MAG TPA: sigma-70 family RNA polymerase sigma factor [Gemmatimonadaceae bacterium]
MTQLSDRELIAAASQGQVGPFSTLVSRYRDVRTRFAIRMLGNYDAADEALQVAFVRALQSISRCKEPERFEDWLFRIVINECRMRALRQVVRTRRATGEVDAIADWRAAVEGSENGADVQQALNQIDPINREAFILQYVEELTYPQIASLTGASVVTLERQVDRAVSRLRELLPKWRDESASNGPGLEPTMGSVGPSFAVRVSTPLRRAEVLNDSFDDRLMTKLLRAAQAPVDSGVIAATPATAHVLAAPPAREPALSAPPPSPATMAEPALFPRGFSLPSLTNLRRIGIALGLSAAAFGAGYAVRGHSDAKRLAGPVPRQKPTTKIVRRTDTLRVVRGDTVVLARFALSEPEAKSVALIGDFNRWDPSATPLQRGANGNWARTLRLPAGRYDYAFLVDGKRWVTDRFAPSSHDAFDVQSSVFAARGDAPKPEEGSASSRLKKVLPHATAERVLATIAAARSKGLPGAALENRALKYAAKDVKPKDIEDAIAADAEAMARARQIFTAAGRKDPNAEEIDVAAQLLGEGADSASISALAQFAAAGRPIDVPLHVGAELVAMSSSPKEMLARVEDRVRSGATDDQLEQMLNEPARSATASKAKGKPTQVAKHTPSANVHQAGTPSKKSSSKKKGAE